MSTAAQEVDFKLMSTEQLMAMHAEKVQKILAPGPLSDARNASDTADIAIVAVLYAEINSRDTARD